MVDGDKSLVVADTEFIKVVERNMEGIVPLYYHMAKAAATPLDRENMYTGLINAFVGGNIGIYSNNISKIWNDEVFITGSKEAQEEAIFCIKCLCCQNNFVIDYAKTLYKPEFPPEVAEKVAHFTKKKLPAFFEFAKDKTPNQVCGRNGSFVNKIYNKIKKNRKPILFRSLGIGMLNYRMMMHNPDIEIDTAVINKYKKLNRTYQYVIGNSSVDDSGSYLFNMIKKEFEKFDYSWQELSDMLIKDLYSKKTSSKQMYWFLFGWEAVEVLKKNIKVPLVSYRQCKQCGEFYEIPFSQKRNPTLCQNCRVLGKIAQ